MARISPLIQFSLSKKYFIKPAHPQSAFWPLLGCLFSFHFRVYFSVWDNRSVTCTASDQQGPLSLVCQGGPSRLYQTTFPPTIENYRDPQVSIKNLIPLHLHALSLVQSTPVPVVGLTLCVSFLPSLWQSCLLQGLVFHLASTSWLFQFCHDFSSPYPWG